MDNRYGSREIRWLYRSRSLKTGAGKLSEHQNTWMNGEDREGRSCCLILAAFRNSASQKKSVLIIVDVLIKIRTERNQNICQNRYHLSQFTEFSIKCAGCVEPMFLEKRETQSSALVFAPLKGERREAGNRQTWRESNEAMIDEGKVEENWYNREEKNTLCGSVCWSR